jgi:hypothetical protein
MSEIPEGYGVIAGRSKANAQAALAAAVVAGVDPVKVLTTREGYLVPDAVLEAFHAGQEAPAEESEDTKPVKKAPAKAKAKAPEKSEAQPAGSEADGDTKEKDE